jgi:hypothetical protein
VLALAGAVTGFVSARAGSPNPPRPQPPQPVRSAELRIAFSDYWRRTREPLDVPGLRFRAPISLVPARAPAAGGLVVGQVAGGGPTLLPAGFEGTAADDDRVKLGRLEARRYRGVRVPRFDERLILYVAPNTSGVATVACFGGWRLAGFASECERIATTLELVDPVRPYGLGPRQEYADELNRIIGTLNRRRTAARRVLREAGTPRGQSRAAATLSRAHADAWGTLDRVSVGPAESSANSTILTGLRRSRDAYERMGLAARAGERGRFTAASRSVERAEDRVEEGLEDLEPLGYRIGAGS